MSYFADLLGTIFERSSRDLNARSSIGRTLLEATDDLISSAGEVSSIVTAQDIIRDFKTSNDEEKLKFFRHVASGMNIDPTCVHESLLAYQDNPSKSTYREFMKASEPPRQEFFRRLNLAPNATGSLVRMREDLLRLGKGEPMLEALDLDIQHLFQSWFNRGFLVLRPISWKSPAQILEKIIRYEAVHSIESWDDLRRRLEPSDRRCFAFFHPSMPDDPLIFVEVALTNDVPTSIQSVLAADRHELRDTEATTAVFYSISNCQAGLAKISFGNFLIKQVAADLKHELPGLSTFITLSPIPLLTKWLKRTEIEWDNLTPTEAADLAAHYLLNAKANNGFPFDPVARFHLGNGAEIFAVHPEADVSEKGQKQSVGAMVNYIYDMETVAKNHENFAGTKEITAAKSVLQASQRAAENMLLSSQ